MSQHDSAITTSQKALGSRTGTPAGELGSAMNAGSPATPDQAARILSSAPRLLEQPISSTEAASELQQQAEFLRRPAPAKWLMGRVLRMLSHYYVADNLDGALDGLAEDWAWELDGLPAWAVSNAVRWWMSSENHDRRKKPMPGDISERAKYEMRGLTVIDIAIKRFERGGNILPFQAEQPRERLPADERQKRANDILAAAGFSAKRFPEVGEGTA